MSASAPTSASRKRPVVPLAEDADVVLKRVRRLRDELVRKAEVNVPAAEEKPLPIGVPSDILEVSELSNVQVIEGMEGIATRIATQVLHKRGLSLEVPSRASSNQIYVKEWDRIVLGGKKSTRNFLNVRESRKTAITIRVMQLLHTGTFSSEIITLLSRIYRLLQYFSCCDSIFFSVLIKRIHITKRDLFYTDVKLFVDQADSDGVLDDVATMIGCTRSNLNVVASDKGLVVGRIQFEEDGDSIDCTKMGVGGKAIPPYIDKIENITSDAEFILLVEKEAVYMRMAVRISRSCYAVALTDD